MFVIRIFSDINSHLFICLKQLNGTHPDKKTNLFLVIYIHIHIQFYSPRVFVFIDFV